MMGQNKQVVLEKGAKKGHMEKTVELHIWRKVHSYKDKGHHQEVPIKAITEVRKETQRHERTVCEGEGHLVYQVCGMTVGDSDWHQLLTLNLLPTLTEANFFVFTLLPVTATASGNSVLINGSLLTPISCSRLACKASLFLSRNAF